MRWLAARPLIGMAASNWCVQAAPLVAAIVTNAPASTFLHSSAACPTMKKEQEHKHESIRPERASSCAPIISSSNTFTLIYIAVNTSTTTRDCSRPPMRTAYALQLQTACQKRASCQIRRLVNQVELPIQNSPSLLFRSAF